MTQLRMNFDQDLAILETLRASIAEKQDSSNVKERVAIPWLGLNNPRRWRKTLRCSECVHLSSAGECENCMNGGGTHIPSREGGCDWGLTEEDWFSLEWAKVAASKYKPDTPGEHKEQVDRAWDIWRERKGFVRFELRLENTCRQYYATVPKIEAPGIEVDR